MTGMIDEKKACAILSGCESLGPRLLHAMRSVTGSYAECLLADPEIFAGLERFGKKKKEALRRIQESADRLSEEYEGFMESGIKAVFEDEDDYPSRLRYIGDAPPLIYVRGRLPDDDKPSAAIIGARKCSDYGITAAEYFAAELAAEGIQIISGMACGIDGAAARGALKKGADSFAVLGSGVDVCYPAENSDIYRCMSGTGGEKARGGIISEFHPLAAALPVHFVMRNRIIAGLGDVLLVIEAREKSGTSITVGYALDQGKEVFALPGRITDPLGRGCNMLLRDGASPLTEPSDVLGYFGIGDTGQVHTLEKDLYLLTDDERLVYGAMTYDIMHIEDIALASGLKLGDAMRIVAALEKKGFAANTGRVYYKKL